MNTTAHKLNILRRRKERRRRRLIAAYRGPLYPIDTRPGALQFAGAGALATARRTAKARQISATIADMTAAVQEFYVKPLITSFSPLLAELERCSQITRRNVARREQFGLGA